MIVIRRLRSFAWWAFHRRRAEQELSDELQYFLERSTADKALDGLPPKEAQRISRIELRGLVQTQERVRAVQGIVWLDAFVLDIKLGLRMLRRAWGLTLAGGFAMAVVIGIAAGAFTIFYPAAWGTLPLDEGDRVVALKTWDREAQRQRIPSLSDFERWRDSLQLVEDVSAFRTVERNLAVSDGPTESVTAAGDTAPVSIAQMTASGFELARVTPLLGRFLLAEDEVPGAPRVVVISYEVWQSRFASNPQVLGRTMRLGSTIHTIVGVMPEGFAFPVNHRLWTPLRADLLDNPGDEGPEVFVFARLARGVTPAAAEAELGTRLRPSPIGQQTSRQLQPRVVPYTRGIVGSGEPIERVMFNIGMFLISLIIVPPCANIAILVYARIVTRQEEFAARHALGASRGRIVAQLFVEVSVLAVGAAAVALGALRIVLQQGLFYSANDPFWIDYSDISLPTVLFAFGLALLAAFIAGAIPAVKATGKMMQPGLRALGSATGMRLGATWTALVVAQIAFSMAALPTTVEVAWGSISPSIQGPGFAASDFLTAKVTMDRDGGRSAAADSRPFASRFGILQAQLVRQLKAEPGVREMTVSSAVPGAEPWAFVEVEDVGDIDILASSPVDTSGRQSVFLVGSNRVDDVFFEVFDIPFLTGTGFDPGDFAFAREAVVVNRSFAEDILGDQNPLGRRVRYVSARAEGDTAPEFGPWYEIVGVVGNVPANSDSRTIYHPGISGEMHPASFSLKVGPASVSVASRLREIANGIDPTLRVDEILTLDEVYRRRQLMMALPQAYLLGVVTLSVLLLSAAGLYALMSFTVNQRRREIGIRTALGAQPWRLLAGIFRRAMGQVGIGALVGLLVAMSLDYYFSTLLESGRLSGIGFKDVPGVVPGTAALMVLVGLFAVVEPSLRALRVEPTEALREG